VLQPLVENAIKHGIARRSQGGAVRVDASQSNGTLRLSVYNDGPLLPADWESTQGGTGIANLKDRLQILYGTNFNLRLENSEASGVLVSVSVPFQEA
jgi:LytS/YehU family sensor histidine kinase